MTAAEKVLIVGPSWVGDMVMAQSLYRLLHARVPARELHVLAPSWSLPILARMPEVAHAIELPIDHGRLGLAERRRIGHRLRAAHYDWSIILPRSLKAALVPYFARIPRRTGFRGEWRYGFVNDMRPFDPERLDQTVRRFVALGLAADEHEFPEFPWPRLSVDSENKERLAQRLGLDTSGPIAALMPGAEYGPAKRWPPEKFVALARRLTAAGVSTWLLGSAKERDLGSSVAAAVGDEKLRNLCGETTLNDVIDLLAAASVAVTNDSGLMHVAAAVGTEVVAIYGSSTPAFTPPLTNTRRIHYLGVDCSPCFERECPLGHLNCLLGIDVDAVAADAFAVIGVDG